MLLLRNAALFRPVKTNGGNQPPKTLVQIPADKITPAELFDGIGKIDTEKMIDFKPQVDESVCSHLDQIKKVFPSAAGCEDCLRIGDEWVHLRICLTCGHVGCCDTSKNKHATAHFHDTTHPLMKSMERGEDWAWCFEDENICNRNIL